MTRTGRILRALVPIALLVVVPMSANAHIVDKCAPLGTICATAMIYLHGNDCWYFGGPNGPKEFWQCAVNGDWMVKGRSPQNIPGKIWFWVQYKTTEPAYINHCSWPHTISLNPGELFSNGACGESGTLWEILTVSAVYGCWDHGYAVGVHANGVEYVPAHAHGTVKMCYGQPPQYGYWGG